MARSFNITINDVTYSGHTASAKEQIEMLNISSRNNLLPMLKDEISDMAIVALLSLVDVSDLKKINELCINKGNVKRETDGVPVAENLFNDDVCSYYLLLSKVLKENIGNFWKLNSIGKGETTEQV